jgi:alginate O-acetyltransferase complex protein AlgI
MLFNSLEFAIFFPVVTILFFMLPHKFRWALLLGASCFFYMFFKPVYIFILGFTIIIDYFAGIWISKQADAKKRKGLLILSILANVGVLIVFKYYNFIIINLNLAITEMANGHGLPLLNILLPIGLSFHTFQAMSYTIEVYRGNQKPENHFGIYALYVMFYPQLVAGPIERPQNMLHQFHEKKEFDYQNARSGMILITWGLFKKVVIADRLGMFVNNVYAYPHEHTGIPLILGTVFFAIQIFCDFSGYTDIAIGSARVMGFHLMTNFNSPFISQSITEFWRRWHISLSTWFNDYLFKPIITSARNWGKTGIAFGLFITFFLSGLWHGAGWTFIIYGLMHGIGMIYEFYTKKIRKKIFNRIPLTLNKVISAALTFSFVAISWIFFRSPHVDDAFYIIGNLTKGFFTQLNGIISNQHLARMDLLYLGRPGTEFILAIVAILFLTIVHFARKNHPVDQWIIAKPKRVRWAAYYGIILIFITFGIFNKTSFIYFQF